MDGIPFRPVAGRKGMPQQLLSTSNLHLHLSSLPLYTSTFLAICDSDAGRVTVRRLPFDFKSYVAGLLAHGIELPAWLCGLLRKASAGRTR